MKCNKNKWKKHLNRYSPTGRHMANCLRELKIDRSWIMKMCFERILATFNEFLMTLCDIEKKKEEKINDYTAFFCYILQSEFILYTVYRMEFVCLCMF